MEINNIDEVKGVVTTADVVEGRMGLLTSHSFSYDFGSKADLPGFKVPATAEEAKRAHFMVTFAVDNVPTPFYKPMPSFDWALRQGGWDQAANAPFSATVYLTHPGNQEGRTIASGELAQAYEGGSFTLPSGSYIYDSNIIVPGANVIVANTAEDGADAGKVKYQSTVDARVVGVVERYDSTTKRLTVSLY